MKKFEKNDIFVNRLKTFPHSKFIIFEGTVFYNNRSNISGAFSDNVGNVPLGNKNLYELNVDRPSNSMIVPFIFKNSQLDNFKTVNTGSFRSDFNYGDTITGSYNLSSSISSDYYTLGENRPRLQALRNTLNFYTKLSPHFEYISSLGGSGSLGDKSTQPLRLISIPSIFYGSQIEKGSVKIKFYISGTLAGELSDTKHNGELIQTTGSFYSGSSIVGNNEVAGVVLYNEGFIILTGSWDLSEHTENYENVAINSASWLWSLNTSSFNPSSSFSLEFNGTQYIPTVTMFCHAAENELNFSNNPTFLQYEQSGTSKETFGKLGYYQNDEQPIKNTVKTNFNDPTGSFEKQVFINKIGIYDKDKNLIGIAKLSSPIRKREKDGFTFKIKTDL